VIKSFRHKGVQKFYETGSKAGIQAVHASKLNRLLTVLDVVETPSDMNKVGFVLHSLSGSQAGRWSVWVNGNWRLTFEFEPTDVIPVDYQDYH
jgi:proteic killer suppression protein